MLHIVWMCIIGLVAGALAKLIMPGKDPDGMIVTMLLGIAGALVAGFIGRAVGLYEPGQGAGLIMSVFGAILLLVVYRLFKRSTACGVSPDGSCCVFETAGGQAGWPAAPLKAASSQLAEVLPGIVDYPGRRGAAAVT